VGLILLRGSAAFQSELGGLGKWAGTKHVDINKDKCKTLPLGWTKVLINE